MSRAPTTGTAARTAQAPLRIDLAGGWSDVPAFADVEGGCVVNVAIDRYVDATLTGETIGYEHDLHTGGLGSSGCEHVLSEALRRPGASLEEIAELAFEAECAEGVPGGRQDQYAACFGGMSCMTFSKPTGTTRPVSIERLEPAATASEIERRLVLVDTGVSRLSGNIHDAVWGEYARGAARVTGALRALRDLGHAMRGAIVAGDLADAARVMRENWRAQKELHATVTNPLMDELVAYALAHGAAAGKACGAGGGGAMVFLCDSGAAQAALRNALRARSVSVIDFAFAPAGLTVTS